MEQKKPSPLLVRAIKNCELLQDAINQIMSAKLPRGSLTSIDWYVKHRAHYSLTNWAKELEELDGLLIKMQSANQQAADYVKANWEPSKKSKGLNEYVNRLFECLIEMIGFLEGKKQKDIVGKIVGKLAKTLDQLIPEEERGVVKEAVKDKIFDCMVYTHNLRLLLPLILEEDC